MELFDPSTQSGRRRVFIDGVRPQIECGRFPIKRVLHDSLEVEVDLLVDGHDQLAGALLWRPSEDATFHAVPLSARGNDRFAASFALSELGLWQYTVEAWVDDFATVLTALRRKLEAGQPVAHELAMLGALVEAAGGRAGQAGSELRATARSLADASQPTERRARLAQSPELATQMARLPDRRFSTRLDPPREVVVDPPLARFSSWYELFPRSCGRLGEHGTLADAAERLAYVADLGFDVVYLPPIHPIGVTGRKGRDGALRAEPDDPGSPWAIGAADGGHKAVHPQLGTTDDLRRFVARARALGLELALDIAFQASPDHPYVKAHPEWFIRRPDGTIAHAENPPKQYQDVYPFDFTGEAWQSLWEELASVFEHWIAQGVRIFRVDNPHTKPIAFWQFCINRVKREHPEVIFLAEAFTRPKMMYMLAKVGFTQSYTYFTWRTSKPELVDYMHELVHGEVAEYFRPSFWPNTPDILPDHLQDGGRPTFAARAALAATLSSNYGIYGPAFELCERAARAGTEEYASSEKYELRSWQLDQPGSLGPLLARLNRIRRDHRALQDNCGLVFHRADNDLVLCYSKRSASGDDLILCAVSLDPEHRHSAWIDLDLAALGISPDESLQLEELLCGGRRRWRGGRAFLELAPEPYPVQIFHVSRRAHDETTFEYYR
jgi:starch synthase (maltosyl-transferring)